MSQDPEPMETVVEATQRLAADGYEANLVATDGGKLLDSSSREEYEARSVRVDEIVRFEGQSDPGDESILYAITAPDGTRGVYSAVYGPEAEAADDEVVKVLSQLPPADD